MTVKVVHKAGFAAIGGALDDVSRAYLEEAGSAVEAQVKARMKRNVNSEGHRGKVQSGATMRAVQASEPVKTQGEWTQTTAFQAPHEVPGAVAELGRRKGKRMPPIRVIERWAKRKLGPVRAASGRFKPGGRARAERSRAYLIARKIKRKGTPGLHMFKRTAENFRRGRAQRIWDRVVRRFKARGGGA